MLTDLRYALGQLGRAKESLIGGVPNGGAIAMDAIQRCEDALNRAIEGAERIEADMDVMLEAMDGDEGEEHEHEWGPFERSRFAGTVHRKCQVAGCREFTLEGDEDVSEAELDALFGAAEAQWTENVGEWTVGEILAREG